MNAFLAVGLLATLFTTNSYTNHLDNAAPQQTNQTGFGHTNGWKSTLEVPANANLQREWKQTVGMGYSQVVGEASTAFVTSGSVAKSENSERKRLTTTLSALDTSTGKLKWSYDVQSEMGEDQESFGGSQPAPQATPLLIAGNVVFSTFSGELIAVDATDGQEAWKKSMTDDLGAEQVQFGFASSPVACPDSQTEFVQLAAGVEGGLIRIDAKTGDVIWKSPVKSFGYGTPVLAEFGGTPQWVVVSRNEVIGIKNSTGEQLWQHPLTEKGLTNVPSPIILDESRLLVSCQGTKGTDCLKVDFENDDWKVEARWHGRDQFFYSNWILLNQSIVLGCANNLVAIRTGDGQRIGRWRGFTDGNLLFAKNRLLVLGGKGNLSVLELNPSTGKLTQKQKFNIQKGRCWVAPSTVGDRIFVRVDEELHCLRFRPNKTKLDIQNSIETGSEIEIDLKLAKEDPVATIFDAFESEGQTSAVRLYDQYRIAGQLSIDQRIELAEAAYQQGLRDIAVKVIRDAQEDFPDSKKLRQKMDSWSGK